MYPTLSKILTLSTLTPETLTFIDIVKLDHEIGIDAGRFSTPDHQEYNKVIVSQTFTPPDNGAYFSFNFARAVKESTSPTVKNYFEQSDLATKPFQDEHGYITLYYHW